MNLNNANDENVTRAVIANHGLHLQVNTLGIELRDQQNRLIYLDCDEG